MISELSVNQRSVIVTNCNVCVDLIAYSLVLFTYS